MSYMTKILVLFIFAFSIIGCSGSSSSSNSGQTANPSPAPDPGPSPDPDPDPDPEPVQFAIQQTIPEQNGVHPVQNRLEILFNEIIDANTIMANTEDVQNVDTLELTNDETGEIEKVQYLITSNKLEVIPIRGFKANTRYTLRLSGSIGSIATENYLLLQDYYLQFRSDNTPLPNSKYFGFCNSNDAEAEYYEYFVENAMRDTLREAQRVEIGEVIKIDLIETDCTDKNGAPNNETYLFLMSHLEDFPVNADLRVYLRYAARVGTTVINTREELEEITPEMSLEERLSGWSSPKWFRNEF